MLLFEDQQTSLKQCCQRRIDPWSFTASKLAYRIESLHHWEKNGDVRDVNKLFIIQFENRNITLHLKVLKTPPNYSLLDLCLKFISRGTTAADVCGRCVLSMSAACGFIYRSQRSPNGTFTSPNYPGFYPRNTECHYLFYGMPNERVHITFRQFDVEGMTRSVTAVGQGGHCPSVRSIKQWESKKEKWRLRTKSQAPQRSTNLRAAAVLRPWPCD